MKKINNLLFVIVTLSGLLLMQACDIRVGYREGGWVHDGPYRNYPHYPRYRDRRSDRAHRGHRYDGRRRNPRHPNAFVEIESDPARILARDYRISYQAADKILRVTSGEKPLREIKNLGLRPSDFASLKNLELPDQKSIDRVAHVLGEPSSKVKNLMQGYITDVKTGNTH